MPNPLANALYKIGMGLIAFVPAARVLATMPSEIIDKFVQGRVVMVTPNQIVVASTSGELLIDLSAHTQVWDGKFVQDIPIALHDQVLAWVIPHGARSGTAERLWVNWVNLEGRVANLQIAESQAHFELNSVGETIHVELDPRTLIASRTTRAPFAETARAPQNGEAVVVSGRRLADGTLLATDIFLPD